MKQNQFSETYSKFLQKFLKPRKLLKIIFDCSNGTAGLILEKALSGQSPDQSLNYKIINGNPDGDFPAHGPNPLKSGATKQLQLAVKKYKADLGIIFDADGDRMLCVDDKGRFVNPGASARLLIWHLKPKKAIVDVGTSWLVKRFKIHDSRFMIHESKVGQYFIKQKMRIENADFGAEHSGHYYFKEFFSLDSGILAAIEIINAVSKLPYRLSDFVDLLPRYYRSEIDLGLKRVDPENLLKAVERAYQREALPTGRQAVKISRLDGLTMEFPDWWFNLRFSQTEPLVRLNIEATEKFKLQEEVLRFKKLLNLK